VVIAAPSPYYLQNFERALAWLTQRYEDLFDTAERTFIAEFARLPPHSRALLVRMLMRKGIQGTQGTLFRTSRLVYEEIGCSLQAAAPLASLGWVDLDPLLTIEDFFSLSTRPELVRVFPDIAKKSTRKADWLDALRIAHEKAQRYTDWDGSARERVLRVTVGALTDRLRLMFFGNLHQDWSEFVLADLGVFNYETVSIAPSARAFRERRDVDAWLALHACREALDALADDASIAPLFAATNTIAIDNEWLETRRAKLLFQIGYRAEQQRDWDAALNVYALCKWPEARYRHLRVLERCARFDEAFALASDAAAEPENEVESQRIARMLPRLMRRLRLEAPRAATTPPPVARDTLTLRKSAEPFAVEYAVRDHLHAVHAPVYYVENALINSLFGLLFWEPVFAPVPGAFFHPFQRGPADLLAPDFYARRADQFAHYLAQLDSDAYRETIRRHFHGKAGLQSPFVFWGALTSELLDLALECLPATHLKLWFIRLLDDIRENRSGLPDLIRFWPREGRYELIEVKGPGDRLQDNQIRWLQYCALHGMPVRVVDVRWEHDASGDSVIVNETSTTALRATQAPEPMA
jgi:hypothetical protein